MKKIILTFAMIIIAVCAAHSQRKVSIGFYNVENLYDTIPSEFYDDAAYTPEGRYGWNTERYNNKLRNIARVLDHMSLDIVGLCEVENETVTRDLVSVMETDYNYIHRSVGKWDGREIALLYKGDKFIPRSVRRLESPSSRDFLYVKGDIAGERLDLIVCHLPSLLNRYPQRARTMKSLYYFVDSLHHADPGCRMAVMGDFNAAPGDNIFAEAFTSAALGKDCEEPLFCPFDSHVADGMGSYAYNYSWRLFDNIFLGASLREGPVRYSQCGIFIHPYMVTDDKTKRKGFPLRTFVGKRYTNGFSDHLPVFVYLTVD